MTTHLTLLATATLAILPFAARPAQAQSPTDSLEKAVHDGREDPASGFDDLRFNPNFRGYKSGQTPPEGDIDTDLGANVGAGGMGSPDGTTNLGAPRSLSRPDDRRCVYWSLPREQSTDMLLNAHRGGWKCTVDVATRRDPRTGLAYIEKRPILEVKQPSPDGSYAVVLLGPAALERKK